MPLVDFPFAGGLDQKVAAEYLDPSAQLADIVNGNFVKINAVDKRTGISCLGNVMADPRGAFASPTAGQNIVSWSKSSLTVMGSETLYTASSTAAGGTTLTGVSPLPPCYATRTPISISTSLGPPILCDAIYEGEPLRVIVFQDEAFNVYATVLNGSGDVSLGTTLLYSAVAGYAPFVVNAIFMPNAPAGERIVIFVQTGPLILAPSNAQSLLAFQYDPGTTTFENAVTIESGMASPAFDVVPYIEDPAGGFLVGFVTSTKVGFDYFTPDLSLAQRNLVTPTAGQVPQTPVYVVGTYGAGEKVWLVYNTLDGSFVNRFYVSTFSADHGFTRTFTFDIVAPFVSGSGTDTVCTGAVRLSPLTILVTWQEPVNPSGEPSTGINSFAGGWLVWTWGTSTPTSSGYSPMGFVPCNRPFVVDGVAYQATIFMDRVQSSNLGTDEASEQATLYLLRFPSPAAGNVLPVATIAKNVVQTASYSTLQGYALLHLPLMSQTDLAGTDFACGVNTLGIDTGANSGTTGPTFAVDFFFDAEHQAQLYVAQELGIQLHIAGATPFVFDGQVAVEDNFFFFPEFTYALPAHPGSDVLPASTVSNGGYGYAVCYARTDASGLVHRSAPSYVAPINSSPPTPPIVTGTTDITQAALYGPAGTLNPPAKVTGTTDVTQTSLYGANGTLGTPIVFGSQDMTAGSLYGSGGSLDGTTLILTVDGATGTLNLSGTGNCASRAAFFAAITAKWPQLTAYLGVNNYLVVVDATRGASASIEIGAGTSTGILGWQSGGSCPGSTVGFNGGFTIDSAGLIKFTDAVAGAFNVGMVGSLLTVTGSWNDQNTNVLNISAYDSANTVTLTAPFGEPSPIADTITGDAWGVEGNPATRTLSLNVNGEGKRSLVINPKTTGLTQVALFAAIENLWPAITAGVDGSGHLVLATVDTGTTQSIVVLNDTANVMLGLATGTYSGTTSTLILTVEGASATLVIDVATNGASQAALFAVMEAQWPLLSPSTNSAGHLVLTGDNSGSAESIVVGSGTVNAVLGLTPGTSTGTDGLGGPQLHITNLSATWGQNYVGTSAPIIEIYRTTLDGSVYFLADTIPTEGPSVVEVLWPATTSDLITDAALQSGTYIYTTGGVLPNINPPAFLLQESHNGRIVGADETLEQLWLSQPFSPGLAIGFSGSLVVPFADGGKVTAVRSMDGQLFVFKATSIWLMSGTNGPGLTGQGSDWSVPRKISTNVGAAGPAGMVLTDVGLFFQSPSGIYLLGRDQSVVFVGKNVVDTLATYPTITSATLVPSATQVRFTCTNGESGATIVYDYLLKQWTTHVYPWITTPIAAACIDANVQRYTLMSADGNLWQEAAPGIGWDEDASFVQHFVPTSVTLGWIKTSQQGYVRCLFALLFAQLLDACGLQLELAVNFNPTIVQTSSRTYAELSASRVPGQAQFYVGAKWNQAMSYQFTLSDTDPGGAAGETGAGARFVSLSMLLDVLGPIYPFTRVSSRT